MACLCIACTSSAPACMPPASVHGAPNLPTDCVMPGVMHRWRHSFCCWSWSWRERATAGQRATSRLTAAQTWQPAATTTLQRSRPTPCCCRSSMVAGSVLRCAHPSEWTQNRCLHAGLRACQAAGHFRCGGRRRCMWDTCARSTASLPGYCLRIHAPGDVAFPGNAPSAAAWWCEWRVARHRSLPRPGRLRCWWVGLQGCGSRM